MSGIKIAPKEIRAAFIESIRRTDTVESFRFVPQERMEFMPGQFLQFVFDQDNRDNPKLNKYLSFSSSPNKDYVEVTKRLGCSEFSQRLKGLKPGAEVILRGPLGYCVFEDGYKSIGFLIGGIGITPVISILGYIMDRGLDTDIRLLYSNRNEEEIAFKQEIDYYKSINNRIRLAYTVTECQPNPPAGVEGTKDKRFFFGCIDRNLLLDEIDDLQDRMLFIFGPPKMVEAMQKLCLEAGCKKENIKTERFIGY